MKITNKEIKYTIEQYNYICSTLRAMGKEQERINTFNTINDYLVILQDERITKNQENINCYNLIYTICNELNEYESNNNFIDYYEEETHEEIKKIYLNTLKKLKKQKTLKISKLFDIIDDLLIDCANETIYDENINELDDEILELIYNNVELFTLKLKARIGDEL